MFLAINALSQIHYKTTVNTETNYHARIILRSTLVQNEIINKPKKTNRTMIHLIIYLANVITLTVCIDRNIPALFIGI